MRIGRGRKARGPRRTRDWDADPGDLEQESGALWLAADHGRAPMPGLRCGENRVARLMREAGIRSQTKKAFKVTTKSSGGLTDAEDLVQRHFQAESPGRIWVSDITYIRTKERWLYLAAVLDLYNREIVGWCPNGEWARNSCCRRSEPSASSPSSGEGSGVPCGPGRAISGAAV